MFEVELDENDAYVDLSLSIRVVWFAPAFRWPPELYGNVTELGTIRDSMNYIRSNIAFGLYATNR